MGFYDAFFGSDQSLYTAYSIIAAIIAICLTILLTATDVPIGNRILIVLFVIITLIPSIFLTLFELTCIVTGGTEPNRWWCHAFAWILAAFIIIYCVVVVVVSLVSLFNYNNAIHSVNNEEQKYKITNNESDNYAKEIIQADEMQTKELEKFNNYRYERFENANDTNQVNIPDIGAMLRQAQQYNQMATMNSENADKKEEPFENKKEPFYNNITVNAQDPLVITTLPDLMRGRQGPPPPPPQGPPPPPPQGPPPQQVSNFTSGPYPAVSSSSQEPSNKQYISSSPAPQNGLSSLSGGNHSNNGVTPAEVGSGSIIKSGFANFNDSTVDKNIVDGRFAAWL
jgi:hypothetical protein